MKRPPKIGDGLDAHLDAHYQTGAGELVAARLELEYYGEQFADREESLPLGSRDRDEAVAALLTVHLLLDYLEANPTHEAAGAVSDAMRVARAAAALEIEPLERLAVGASTRGHNAALARWATGAAARGVRDAKWIEWNSILMTVEPSERRRCRAIAAREGNKEGATEGNVRRVIRGG